ncbi:hypothetical protein V6N13_024083 [Hibiscus sabdariffa]
MVSLGTAAKLPVIDFSNQNLKPGTSEWDSAKHQVQQALEEYGCFRASSDQVVELREAVFGAMEEVFDLPLETKKLYVSDKPFRGYFGHPSKLLESMMIDEAQIAENIEQRLTTTLWPQGNTSFSKTLVSFTELSTRLEKTIRRMILEIFGMDKYVDEHIDSTNYLLKLMKYKAPQTSEPTVGAVAHNDMNTLTILYQNEVDGLQVQSKAGEWIDVEPSPDSFVVMVGESLYIWLNGGLSPAYHRVVVKGNKARYSAGLFSASRGGYRVKAPEELVDDKNPMLFKPFDYEEFLGFYLTQVAPGVPVHHIQHPCCPFVLRYRLGGQQLTHKTLGAMADKHGPVFSIRLGSNKVLVVSSWEMAKECFTVHDKVFSTRPNTVASRLLTYDSAMFGFAPYEPYWREMRKIATVELLSSNRIVKTRVKNLLFISFTQ